MAAIADIDFQENDPYIIAGYECERRLVKRAYNVLLNARTMTAARRAIAENLPTDLSQSAHTRAAELIESIQHHHPAFSRFWGTGLGLRLQRVDSDLCARILSRMRSIGIAALPVHDSFVVPERASNHLLELMEKELSVTLVKIRRNHMKII